ncbi:MAG: response regulator, partial [Panacagrimonas sp.]
MTTEPDRPDVPRVASTSTIAPARPRILCVDDEPAVLQGIGLHLRRRFEVHTATSGAAGLAFLRESAEVAAIMSDMRMPGMDGATLLTRVKERYPET